MPSRPARPLDHCVLPTASLAAARDRLAALGFTVAPQGLHPFGTANACVYLADGTFLEPLAVADSGETAAASKSGNVFTARDSGFRDRVGQEGFSALVFGTSDARADHAEFVGAGISAGPILDFSRPFVDAAGNSDTASFRLAFAADTRAPDALFFTCERVNAPAVDRSALQKHANGVQRINSILLEAPQPGAFVDILASVVRADPVETADGFRFAAANGDVFLAGTAGRNASEAPGLRLAGIVFGVTSLAHMATLLDASGIPYAADGRLTVAAARGQGALFAFEPFSAP